jgi:DNA primase
LTSYELKGLLNEEYAYDILDEIGCHNIKLSGNIINAALPDGDNSKSVCVYLDNYYTNVFTRPEFESKKYKDIITLVEFIENRTPSQSIKRICDICGFNYYKKQNKKSSMILEWIKFVESGINNKSKEEIINPLPNSILDQFKISPVKKWYNEGISCKSQFLYKIGLYYTTERIVIPIYDELYVLVGVKGRILNDKNLKDDDKYTYLYNCPKSKILYGLNKNYNNIKESNEVIVVESEKSVLKLNTLGYKNAVATGSKHISKVQIEKLLRLLVPITIAFDQDVNIQELKDIINDLKMMNLVDINIISDKLNLMSKKESPCDNADTWEVLYRNFKFKI